MTVSKNSALAAGILEHGPQVRRVSLLALVAAVPLALAVGIANDPVNTPKLTLLMIGTALVASIRIAELVQRAPAAALARLWVPAAAIAGPALVSWLANPFRGWTLFGEYARYQGLVPTLVFVAFAILVADAFTDGGRPLMWAIAAAAGTVGALTAMQGLSVGFLDGYTGAAPGVALGTMGNSNFAGAFLAISLPVTVALALIERPRPVLTWSLTALTAAGLIASSSQAAWAAAGGAAAVGLGYWLSGSRRWARPVGVVAAAGAALALISGVLLAERLDIQTGEVRYHLWRTAVSMWQDSPIVGHGPNAYGYESPMFRDVSSLDLDTREIYGDEPHSVILAAAANTGALGVAGLLLAIGWVIRLAREVSGRHLEAVGFVSALAAYLIQSLVSIDEIALRLLAWTSVGGLVAAFHARAGKDPKGKRRTAPSRRQRPRAVPLRMPAALGALALATIALVGWTVSFFLGDVGVLSAGQAIETRPEAAAQQASRALGSPNHYEYRHLIGFHLGQQAVSMGEQGRPHLEAAIDLMSFVPEFPDVLAINDKGRLLLAWSAVDATAAAEAADLLLRAVDLDPYNYEFRRTAAWALLADERGEEAERLVMSFFDEIQDNPAAGWAEVALLRLRDDDLAGARAALARARGISPQDKHVLRAAEVLDKSV